MNLECISLSLKENINVNCFKSSSNKLFTDMNSIGDIILKFGYTLNVSNSTTTYITITFNSLKTTCTFNLPYNTETTYNLPVEGGSYCITLLASLTICSVSSCGGI